MPYDTRTLLNPSFSCVSLALSSWPIFADDYSPPLAPPAPVPLDLEQYVLGQGHKSSSTDNLLRQNTSPAATPTSPVPLSLSTSPSRRLYGRALPLLLPLSHSHTLSIRISPTQPDLAPSGREALADKPNLLAPTDLPLVSFLLGRASLDTLFFSCPFLYSSFSASTRLGLNPLSPPVHLHLHLHFARPPFPVNPPYSPPSSPLFQSIRTGQTQSSLTQAPVLQTSTLCASTTIALGAPRPPPSSTLGTLLRFLSATVAAAAAAAVVRKSPSPNPERFARQFHSQPSSS